MEKITFKQFIDSKLKVNKKLYGLMGYEESTIADECEIVYVYTGGLTIEYFLDGDYTVIAGNQHFTSKQLAAAEFWLWNEFGEHELNHEYYRAEAEFLKIKTELLDKFQDFTEATIALSNYWTDINEPGADTMLSKYYPKCLPSFDEFRAEVVKWFEETIQKYK